MSGLRYRSDINGLRALAILSVVVFHWLPNRLAGGFTGVDVFFVISGYLITTIILDDLQTGQFSFAAFYARRIRRIFPALLLVLGASFVYGWFHLLAGDYARLGKFILAGAAFLSNIACWRSSGYFDDASASNPLLHLWSLGIEEQFYLLWPLLLWLAARSRLNILTFVLVLGLASFLVNIGTVGQDPSGTFYLPYTRFWELLIGSVLARLTLAPPIALQGLAHRADRALMRAVFSHSDIRPGTCLRNLLSIIGAVMVVWAATRLKSTDAFPGWRALVPTTGAALLIAAGPEAWFNRHVLSHPLMVFVGLISYPLYLWHWPLLVFARLSEADAYGLAGAVGLAGVLASLTYVMVEKPVQRPGHGWAKVAILLALMVVVAGAGADSYRRAGLPFRPLVKNQSGVVAELSRITSVSDFFQLAQHWRNGKCMAPAEDLSFEQRVQQCVEQQRPLLFLFGDSYAASLYPGLKALQGREGGFGIAQFTHSNAPPFFDDEKRASDWLAHNPTLAEINAENVKAVALLQPRLVVISYMYNGMNGIADMGRAAEALQFTVNRIRAASPQSRVLVVGPVPHWAGNLKDVMVGYAREHGGSLPPRYSNYKRDLVPAEWDSFLKAELQRRGIDYVSAHDALCNQSGCLTRVSDAALDLTASDWGHLTPAGSAYFVDRIKGRLLSELK